MQACYATIVKVETIGKVPTGTYTVKLQDGSYVAGVPQLLPMACFRYSESSEAQGRQPGGGGFLPIAPEGSHCLVTFVGKRGTGKGGVYIIGFYSPKSDQGGRAENPKKIQPGGFNLMTPFGTGVSLHASGAIEIEANDKCRRRMTPLIPDQSDDSVALIDDLCRNYVLRTACGEVRFGELTEGKSAYKARIFELSRWSPDLHRKMKNLAESGADALAVDDEGLAASMSDRFIEIEYGTLEAGDGIYREKFSGSQGSSVELFCDGKGGWKTSADESTEEAVGALIQIRATKDGSRVVKAGEATYQVVGAVRWMCSEFEVVANELRFVGGTRFNAGVQPSARRWDFVQVGQSIGVIITGDPMVRHGTDF